MKYFTFKSRSQSQSAIFAVTPCYDKCKNLQMSPQIFALALTVSEIHKFLICYLQKVGQDYGVQFCQLHHSMVNVKIYKCLQDIFFALALTVSEVLKMSTILLSKSRFIGCCGRFGRGASLYRHRSQLFGRLGVRLPMPIGQFSDI